MKEGMVNLQWTVGVNSTMTVLLDKKNESIYLRLDVSSILVTRPSVVITNARLKWSIVLGDMIPKILISLIPGSIFEY